jgi:hypothetical protein
MLIFLNLQTSDYANAQLRRNMTLKCSPGGECITEICINNQSCDTIISDPSKGIDLREFLENKTKVTFIPREII